MVGAVVHHGCTVVAAGKHGCMAAVFAGHSTRHDRTLDTVAVRLRVSAVIP